MKIDFIRHGQTRGNKERMITGHLDIPLIEEGVKQAQEVALSLVTDYSVIYSSDLLRCKQTADILNEKLNLPIVYDARLRERDFGSFSGKPWAEMEPGLELKDESLEYDYHSFGGESFEDVKQRVLACVADIQNKHRNEKVLVVTSGGIVRALHHIFHGELHKKIHNATLHEFEFPDN